MSARSRTVAGVVAVVVGLGSAACASVEEAEVTATTTTAEPEQAAPEVMESGVYDEALLPTGWPMDLPRPDGGVLGATSAEDADGGLDASAAEGFDWAFYLVPNGQLDAVTSDYKASVAAAGYPVAEEARPEPDRVELMLGATPPIKARFSQTDGGVVVVVLRPTAG